MLRKIPPTMSVSQWIPEKSLPPTMSTAKVARVC